MMSRITAALRLVGLLAAFFAPPLVLAATMGWPLPSGPVDPAVVVDSITSGLIDPSVWINVLATAAWIAWLIVAAMVAVEVVTILRDRPTSPRTPRFVHRLAQLLVATAIAVGGPTHVALAYAGPPTATVSAGPTMAGTADIEASLVEDRTDGLRQVTVEDADSWSGFADRTVGDATRGGELRGLNDGRTMANGTTIGPDTLFVEPSWTLLVPDVAAADVPAPKAVQVQEPSAPTAADVVAGQDDFEAASASEAGDGDSGDGSEPADDDVSDVPETAAVGEAGEWVVVEGDSMWSIAEDTLERHTGDEVDDDTIAPYWRDVVDANLDNLLPPEDPDLIYPGQVLDLPPIGGHAPAASDPSTSSPQPETAEREELAAPAPAADAEDAPVQNQVEAGLDTDQAPDLVSNQDSAATAAGAVDDGDVAGGGHGSGTVMEDTGGLAPTPKTSPGDAADGAVAPASPAVPLEPVVEAAAADSGADDADTVPWGLLSGMGVVAAGVVGALTRLRRQRLRRRRQTGMVPPRPPVTDTEPQLRAAQDPDTVWLLDRVLRDLASRLDPENPPSIAGVSFDNDRVVSVLLTEPAPAPPGWSALNSHEWQRDLATIDPAVLDEAEHYPGPLPALVTIGTTSAGLLQLDLEHLEVTVLEGPAADVQATMATMAIELATSPLADDIEIVCVGFGADQLDVFTRITCTDDQNAVVQLVTNRTATAADLAVDMPADSPALAGRLAGVAASWTPTVVFDFSGAVSDQVATLATSTPRCGVALVAPATSGIDADWCLAVDGDQIRIVAGANLGDVVFTRRRDNLTGQQRSDIAALVDHERHAADIPINPPRPRPTATPAPTAAAVDAPTIRLLGTVGIDDTERDFRRSQGTELLGYLALHPRGITADTLMERLWPGQRPDNNRLNRVVSDARGALGTDDDGGHHLPHVRGGTSLYRVTAVIADSCDLNRLLTLTDRARSVDDPDEQRRLLTAALDLVHGEPFTGTGAGWGWAHAEGWATSAITTIDTAATTLARQALADGDHDLARWAITRGLAGNPGSIDLYALRLDVAAAAGSLTEADAVMNEARAALTHDDGPEYDDMLLGDLTTAYTHIRTKLAA